jgi:hypothetical protein
MGKVIAKKIRGLNLWAKVALTVLFTLTLSVFMYEGWYRPGQTQAAISTLTTWSNIYTNSAGANPGTISYAVSAGSGVNRLLVVAVSTETSTAASQTCTVTYGTRSMTSVRADGGTTQGHSFLFYLKEADLDLASNTNLVFTMGGATAALTNVYAAVFDGVDQTTPISANTGNTGTTSVALTTALTVSTGDQAVEVVSMGRATSGTARTITTPDPSWTQNLTNGITDATRMLNSYILTDTTAGSTTASHTISSTSASTYSMSAMSIKAATASTNANLSNLVLSTGTLSPAFSSTTTSYTASVANSVTSITVTPTEQDTTATTTVNGTAVNSGTASGPISLAVGANTITTVVTAQDGITKKTYTVVVTRAGSSNADLSNLVLSAGTLSPAFASATLSYTASVANTVASITVTPTEADTTATTTVNGTAVNSGTASGPIALAVGANTITTVVTAQDGTTTKTYTVVVTRAAAASSNANLSNLVLSAGTLSPAFASGTISYTASVSNPNSSITVTPTVEDATATVKVNGTTVASGTASGAIALVVGSNTITTVVTAQDTTTKTYTVTVTRAAAVNSTTAGALTYSGITSSAITVTAPYTGDDNNNNSCVIKWGTVNGTYPNTATAVKSGTSYVATISGLSASTTYYFQATFTDVDGRTPTNGIVTGSAATVAWVNPLMHSSANLGTKYGDWGAGKDCTWCHIDGTNNVKQVAQQIATPTGNRNVTFLKMTSSTTTSMDLFGNDERLTKTKSSNICEVCHHQTNYHQYSSVTKATGKSVTSTSHYNRVDCASCHKHGTGFKPSGHTVPYYATSTGHTGCASGIGCHTNSTPAGAYPTTGGTAPNCQACHTKGDPLTANIGCGSCHGAAGGTGEPNGTVHPNAVGSHPKHTALTTCTNCHNVGGTGGNADHGPGNRGTNPAIVNLASTLGWSGAPNNNCTTASCHANVYGTTGYATTPAWGTAAGCGACHTGTPGAFQANGAPNTGGHNIHMTAGAACGDCHTGAVVNTTGGNSHADGYVNVANGYNGGNPVTKHASGSGYSTCTAASCHADPYSAATVTTNTWSATSGGCVACHKNAANNNNQAAFVGYSTPSTQAGPWTGSHDEHLNYDRYTCGDCHAGAVSGSTGGSNHGNGVVNIIQYAAPVAKHAAPFTYTVNGCAQACHIAATWGGQLRCIDCHAQTITRKKGRAAGDVLDAVTAEFAKTYGHKKVGRNAVADDDCIVCHLEGRSSDHKTSKYHADGNIDLRDPWGTGETPITNMSGGAFTFQRFSTSYASGSRKSTLNSTDIAQVISLRFCIRCHSSQGATNPTARSANGTPTGSANMPFGGSTGYTVASGNGVTVAGGTINVFSQFSTSNSSVHPVRGPLNRDFPIASRLSVPYNGQVAGRVAAGGTKTLSVIINCFDCHNTYNGTPKTLRTTAAHGTNNTAMVRGNIYSATAPNLCTICHTGYTGTSNHGSGSAMNGQSDGSEGWATTCWNCHSSTTAKPGRPIPAADYHGFNKLLSGANWAGTGANQRPFAFIRNTTNFIGHRPKASTEWTTGNATCVGDSSHCAGKNGTQSYSPGGQY